MTQRNSKVVLLNSATFPCPGSHLLHTRKFLSAFANFDFEFTEISSTQDFAASGIRHGDLVYISDHGLGPNGPTGEQLDELERISKTGAVPIFWFWQKHSSLLDQIFKGRWIATGEHLRAKNVLESHAEYQNLVSTLPNFVPLSFAAALTPAEVGSHKRDVMFNASFVGHRYQRLLNWRLKTGVRNVEIIYTPPFISEAARIQYFTGSHVVLGWHSEANRRNGNVVERVYEGLAYGSVVVTDNPFALEATDGNVLFADTYEATKTYLERLITDEVFRKQLQQQGVKWAKDNGTYLSVAKAFITKANSIY